MKTVIGVDTQGYYRPAVTLARRLELPEWDVHLTYVVDALTAGASRAELYARFVALRAQEGREELDRAAESVGGAANRIQKEVRRGDPARVLVEVADDLQAELVAVGSGQKGTFGSLYFGSVTKGLLIGARRSVLIGKGDPRPDGPLTAVLATDHSDYVNQCIDRLLAIRPQGLSHVTVLTATRFRPSATGLLLPDLPGLAPEGAGWIREKLTELNERVCDRLCALGCRCDARIAEAHPNEAIRTAMQETGAELLILGAQGHGFWERLTVGSVSFHQAIAEAHSVLMLRA